MIRDLRRPTTFSGGGGVVAEIFRDHRKATKIGGGGGVVAEFFFACITFIRGNVFTFSADLQVIRN